MADSPGDGARTVSDKGSSIATVEAPTSQTPDLRNLAIDANDVRQGRDARPPTRPLDSSLGRKTEAREPVRPIRTDSWRKSDPSPKSVSEASARPQDWREDEPIELHADQGPDVLVHAEESTAAESPEVEAARADVRDVLDRDARVQTARDDVKAALGQADADGPAPNTTEQLEAEFQKQMDEVSTNPDVKQVEFQVRVPVKDSGSQEQSSDDSSKSVPWAIEHVNDAAVGQPTDLAHPQEASAAPAVEATGDLAGVSEVTDSADPDRSAAVAAAEAQVKTAYQEQDARRAAEAAYEGHEAYTIDDFYAEADAASDVQLQEPRVAAAEGVRDNSEVMLERPEAQSVADQAPDTQAEADAVARNVEDTELANINDRDWHDASPERKQELVQEVSDATADGLGISPCDVRIFEPANPKLCGQYSRESNSIDVSSVLTRDEAIRTVVHETRHAYQSHKVESGDHPMSKDWESNFNGYFTGEDNYAKYALQPLEADAWDFELRVRDQL